MSEDDIRQEILCLIRQKDSITHSLKVITPNDFDFVRCANRRVRRIDGDAPFDGAGISQVYSNGAIYIRLNSLLLEKRNVSVYYAYKIFPWVMDLDRIFAFKTALRTKAVISNSEK